MALNDFGDVPAGVTLPIMWSSHDLATGANEAMSGLAVTDIEVFKNGSVTQRSVDNGYVLLDTDGIDFDGMVGVNGVSIDLADNTDAGFYAVGSFYDVWIGPITVDTQTVNIHAATFRIRIADPTTGYIATTLDLAQAEPTGVPAAGGTPLNKLGVMFAALRNKVTVTGTKKKFFDDADVALWEKDLTDDGTTYTETEANAP